MQLEGQVYSTVQYRYIDTAKVKVFWIDGYKIQRKKAKTFKPSLQYKELVTVGFGSKTMSARPM